MDKISFSEISDWQAFEDLVTDYFRQVQNDKEFNVCSVEVQQTGAGSDGGRDILVTLNVDDSIQKFHRIWVVQCKFYERDVHKGDLADVNIPTLIHQYGADGYLLVCKKHLTAPLTNAFEELRKNCVLNYGYEFWNGTNFINRIRMKPSLIASYFPLHHQFLEQRNKLIL